MTKWTKEKERVYHAARRWHHWLMVDGVGADYRKYHNAFKRLKIAVSVAKRKEKK
jgi:hypothetical protein